MNQRVLPEGHPDIAITQSGMAVLLLETERSQDALTMAAAAIETLSQTYGEGHWRTAWARSIQGAALAELQRFTEAEPLLVNGYESLRDNSGARPAHAQKALERVANLYMACGRPEAGESYNDLLEARATD